MGNKTHIQLISNPKQIRHTTNIMARILESDKAGVRIQIRGKNGIHVATESFPIYSPFFLLFNKTKQKTTQPNHLSDGDWKTLEMKKNMLTLSYYTALKQTIKQTTSLLCLSETTSQTKPTPNPNTTCFLQNKQDQHQQKPNTNQTSQATHLP